MRFDPEPFGYNIAVLSALRRVFVQVRPYLTSTDCFPTFLLTSSVSVIGASALVETANAHVGGVEAREVRQEI